MIYTITLTPAIEKRVRGRQYDELRFDAHSFSYNMAGTGIKVSTYLKHFKMDTTALFLGGSKACRFINEELNKKEIPSVFVETNVETPMKTIWIDENEDVVTEKEIPQKISDAHLRMFTSVIANKMDEKSTVVFEYNDTSVSLKAMQYFYTNIANNCALFIGDLHPKYYDILTTRKGDVLLIDEKNFKEYMNDEVHSLNEIVDIIQNELTPLANIIIYMHTPNDFIVFYQSYVYRVLSMVKLATNKIYKEAILASIVKSLESDCNFEEMCRDCVKMSTGANISDGLFITTDLTMERLEESVHIYEVQEGEV